MKFSEEETDDEIEVWELYHFTMGDEVLDNVGAMGHLLHKLSRWKKKSNSNRPT